MSETIRSVKFKNGAPIVSFDKCAGENSTISSTYPGVGSEPVLPSLKFEAAIAHCLETITAEDSLSVELEWRLDAIALNYDEEANDGATFTAKLSAFTAGGGKRTYTWATSSTEQVSPGMRKAIEMLEVEAIAFVRGASAQGNLFSVDAADMEDLLDAA
jgi:hypothetical protein